MSARMPGRLPGLLRRRDAERRRVVEFVAAIRATAPRPATPGPAVVPVPRVRPIETPRGIVWQLEEESRARLPIAAAEHEAETNALPLSLVLMMVRP